MRPFSATSKGGIQPDRMGHKHSNAFRSLATVAFQKCGQVQNDVLPSSQARFRRSRLGRKRLHKSARLYLAVAAGLSSAILYCGIFRENQAVLSLLF